MIRDEPIRSLHNTIRIDTKGADMIWVVVKIQLPVLTTFTFFYLLSQKINKTDKLFY